MSAIWTFWGCPTTTKHDTKLRAQETSTHLVKKSRRQQHELMQFLQFNISKREKGAEEEGGSLPPYKCKVLHSQWYSHVFPFVFIHFPLLLFPLLTSLSTAQHKIIQSSNFPVLIPSIIPGNASFSPKGFWYKTAYIVQCMHIETICYFILDLEMMN